MTKKKRKKPRAVLTNRLYVENTRVTDIHRYKYTYHIGNVEDPEVVYNFREYRDYTGFCRGDIRKAQKAFRKFRVVDKRAIVPLPRKFWPTFTGLEGDGFEELLPEQHDCLLKWVKRGYGQLKAPPRWGKTVWLSALVCLLKQRTLILAHEADLLENLLEEFYKWTDVRELERFHNQKLAGFLKTWNDFYPILTVSTWQKFYRGTGGSDQLRDKRDHFGLVGIDESHKVSAACYTKVFNHFNPYFRVGVTATPELTKTELHCIANDVVGPVTAIAKGEQLSATVTLVRTPYRVTKIKDWGSMWNKQAASKKRNSFIVHMIRRDVKKRRVVLAVTERVGHCKVLYDMLKEKDPHLVVEIVNGHTSKPARKEIRNRAKRGEIDVIIGMSQIIQLGYNIPILSTLHNLLPLTNPENWYQRSSRVRTKMRSQDIAQITVPSRLPKPHPIIRVYYDPGYSPATMAYLNMVHAKSAELGFKVQEFGRKKSSNVLMQSPY